MRVHLSWDTSVQQSRGSVSTLLEALVPRSCHLNMRVASLRAYGLQETFLKESYKHIDKYTRCARNFYNFNRYVQRFSLNEFKLMVISWLGKRCNLFHQLRFDVCQPFGVTLSEPYTHAACQYIWCISGKCRTLVALDLR